MGTSRGQSLLESGAKSPRYTCVWVLQASSYNKFKIQCAY